MKKITTYLRLKKASEIDFNNFNGRFHMEFEFAEYKLSRRKKYIVHSYSLNYFAIKDLKGNVILHDGNTKWFDKRFFKLDTTIK